jgi:SAM-dependent methyltransferase
VIEQIGSQTLGSWKAEEITFGGERVSHLYPNDCYYAHLSIYYFGSQFCRDGWVLDAGSGAGYGSVYLAEHGARFVRAIDISEQGVSFSQHYFHRPNLQFQVMDLQQFSGLNDRFDLIFSSNALEHVPDVSAFFHSAWQLLKPDGVMIVAVPPVIDEASRNANLANPYHLNIWSPRQWYYVLNLYFAEIQPYRHGFEKPDVILDFSNTPDQTVVNEKDFIFEPIPPEQFFHIHTLTVMFVVRKPRPEHELPLNGNPASFVDDSFTRPFVPLRPSSLTAGWQLLGHAWVIAREQGLLTLFRRAVSLLREKK